MRDMVPDIEDAMNEDDAQNTILVTQLLDNSAFLVDTPRGEKKLPTEGNDGRYHIEGTPIGGPPRKPSRTCSALLTRS